MFVASLKNTYSQRPRCTKKCGIDVIVVLVCPFLPSEKMLPDRFATAFVFKF